MAPGGVIDGLDNMGAAVVAALNRRADRKYGREADDRRRAQQLEDRGYAEQLDRTNYARTRNDQQADLQDARKHQGGVLEAVNARQDVATAESNWEQQAQAYSPDMEKSGDLYADLRGSLQRLEDEPRLRRLMALRDDAKVQYGLAQSRINRPTAASRGATPQPPKTVVNKNGTVNYEATAQNFRAFATVHPEMVEVLNKRIVSLNSMRQFEAGAPKKKNTPVNMAQFLDSQAVREMHPPVGDPAQTLQNMLTYEPGADNTTGSFTGLDTGAWWDSALEDWVQPNAGNVDRLNTALRTDAQNRERADQAEFEQARNLYEAKRTELLASIDGEIQPDAAPGEQLSGPDLVQALLNLSISQATIDAMTEDERMVALQRAQAE